MRNHFICDGFEYSAGGCDGFRIARNNYGTVVAQAGKVGEFWYFVVTDTDGAPMPDSEEQQHENFYANQREVDRAMIQHYVAHTS